MARNTHYVLCDAMWRDMAVIERGSVFPQNKITTFRVTVIQLNDGQLTYMKKEQ